MSREWFKEYFGLTYIIGDNTKTFNFNSLKERTKKDVDQILELAKIDMGNKILDIPTGYGSHAIELAKRNDYQIYGLDINPFLLDVAKYRTERSLNVEENLIKLKTKPKFMVKDMRNFSDILNNFNLIYNWFLSFGYFSHQENIKTLHEFHSALKPNGKLLVHTIPRENLQEYLGNEKRKIFPTKILGQEYSEGTLEFNKDYDSKKRILNTTWSVRLNNRITLLIQPIKASILMYSTKEYIKMLKKCGFKNIQTYESYFPFKIFAGDKK